VNEVSDVLTDDDIAKVMQVPLKQSAGAGELHGRTGQVQHSLGMTASFEW